MLAKRLPTIEQAFDPALPHATSYDALIERYRSQPAPGHEKKLTPAEVDAIDKILKLFSDAARDMAVYSADYLPKPIPEPALRVRPPL